MATLPANVTYGTVSGRIVTAIGDTADADALPDAVPAEGQVTFSPRASYIKDAAAAIIIAPVDVVCPLVNGYITSPGNSALQSVTLVASDNINLLPNGWTYQVSFDLVGVVLPSFDLLVVGNTNVDLSTYIPVASSTGAVVDVSGVLMAKADAAVQTANQALAASTSGAVPDNGVTNIKVASNAAISLDKTADGTRLAMTAAERTKLSGIATGATANSADATLLNRTNHTGTQTADTIVDGTTNKVYSAVAQTKMAGIATGATANSSDATLLNRANHTGVTPVAGLGTGTPAAGKYVDGGTGAWTTVPAGGSATTDASLLTAGTLAIARIADSSVTDVKLAGGTALSAAERTKLSGIATGATANRSDSAVDTLLAAKVDVSSLSTTTGVVTLAGATPLASEGVDGEQGKGNDGSWWGPKAAGAWPSTQRLADNYQAAGLQISQGLHFAPNIRTAAVTLSTVSSPLQFCDATSGAFVVTLPLPTSGTNGVTTGFFFYIIKTDSTANAVTITAPATKSINGVASYVLSAQYKTATVAYSGGNWFVIGTGVGG